MSSKSSGTAVAMAGLLVALFFALADVIGVGQPGVGFKQIGGAAAGVVILLAGLWLRSRPES